MIYVHVTANRCKCHDKIQRVGVTPIALALLCDPKLLQRIVSDLDACGIVGERTNKLAGYLAATSRKLTDPLAVVIQSSSSAGKTSLMDAILAMLPPELQLRFSELSGQSLYYLEPVQLKHKTLAISEETGIADASYALKLLQSEKELRHATVSRYHTIALVAWQPKFTTSKVRSNSCLPQLRLRAMCCYSIQNCAEGSLLFSRALPFP